MSEIRQIERDIFSFELTPSKHETAIEIPTNIAHEVPIFIKAAILFEKP